MFVLKMWKKKILNWLQTVVWVFLPQKNKPLGQTFSQIPKLISLQSCSLEFQLTLYTTRKVSPLPPVIWYPTKNTFGLEDGWTLAAPGQWFPFPCHQEVNTRTQAAISAQCLDPRALAWSSRSLSVRKERAPALLPLSLPPSLPCPPSLPHTPPSSVLLPSLRIFCLCLGATVAALDSLRSGVTGYGLL